MDNNIASTQRDCQLRGIIHKGLPCIILPCLHHLCFICVWTHCRVKLLCPICRIRVDPVRLILSLPSYHKAKAGGNRYQIVMDNKKYFILVEDYMCGTEVVFSEITSINRDDIEIYKGPDRTLLEWMILHYVINVKWHGNIMVTIINGYIRISCVYSFIVQQSRKPHSTHFH